MTIMTRNEYNTRKALGFINKYRVDMFCLDTVGGVHRRNIIVWGESSPAVLEGMHTHPGIHKGFNVYKYNGTLTSKTIIGINIKEDNENS